MKRLISVLCIIMSLFVLSCKTKQAAITTPAAKSILNSTASKNINLFYEAKPSFKTIYIKADIDYKDSKQAQSVTADIKIEKDQQILVSVRFLGFTVAKALITPTRVQYYEKIGGKYFEGNYTTISQWLGTDLDFDKIQNMILGQPFSNLINIDCEQRIENQNIVWQTNNTDGVQNQYYLSQNPLLLIKQLVSQPTKNRAITIDYQNHERYPQGTIPFRTSILANQNSNNITIDIAFTKITFDEALSFSYSVPSGYEKLEIKQ